MSLASEFQALQQSVNYYHGQAISFLSELSPIAFMKSAENYFIFWSLFFTALVIFSFVFNRLSKLGIPSDAIANAKSQRSKERDNKGKLTFSQLVNLDNPTKKILFNRYLARFFYCFLWFFTIVFIFLLVIFYVLVSAYSDNKFNGLSVIYRYLFTPSHLGIAYIGAGIFIGVCAGALINFFVLRDWLARKDSRTNAEIIELRKQHSARTGEASDVLTLEFADIPEFNPVNYFDQAVQKDAVFLGLDEKRQPILIPRKIWKKSNVQIMGAVGSGKGILACCALAQCVSRFNDAVIIFDPKNDEFAPHVLKSQTEKFLFIDLRQGQPAQLNIFQDLTPYQLNELLTAGLGLGIRGDMADHYRNNDRKFVRLLSAQFPKGCHVSSLLASAQRFPSELKKEANGVITSLEELCSLSVLQTEKGVDLKDFILNGGCVYVVGSTRDQAVIILQKMLFVRCLQIIEERDRLKQTTHVDIMLDEFKYLLSKSSLGALGTIRDKNCNILLTHQSLGDFGECGADMKPDAVKTTVIDNTPIKWVYRMKDFSAAQWVSQMTGTTRVDSERRLITTDSGNVEMLSTEATVFKEERALMDTNTVQHLPDGVAVMIGDGLAKLAYSKPIAVTPAPISVTAFPALVTPTLLDTALSDNNPDIADWEAYERQLNGTEQHDFKTGHDDDWQ